MDIAKIIAHRGAPAYKPENTIASLREAKALGASWVEFDVMLTRDYVPIIIHDDKVNRTTNGKGYVSQMTFAELSRLDAGEGEQIPTLERWLKVAAELGLGINVEIKESAKHAKRIATLIHNALSTFWNELLPKPLISSATYECLEVYRQLDTTAQLAYIVGSLPWRWRMKLAAINACAIVMDYRRIKQNKIMQLHKAGYKVLAYTINSNEKAQQLFALGVDAIFSDDLKVVKQS